MIIKFERYFSLLARCAVIVVFCGALVNWAYPDTERIISFHADIVVNMDATLDVTETIVIWSTGNRIKRGIVRTFPTRYKSEHGGDVVIDFTLKKVLKEGLATPYGLIDQANGKHIALGDETLIGNGKHTYTISYSVDQHLGFYKKYDELYWNVTGNGWNIPIERACARVYLPKTISNNEMRDEVPVNDMQDGMSVNGTSESASIKHVQTDGYTGKDGKQKSHFRVQKEADGLLLFCTTKSLRPYEGLTVVVIWPKGFIAKPAWYKDPVEPPVCTGWGDFIYYNWLLLCALCGAFVLVLFIMRSWSNKRREDGKDVVFPQFYPPEGISAGAARYIIKKGFDATALAAEVMSLAVRGFLTIDYDKSKGYSLIKKERDDGDASVKKEHDASGAGYEYALLAAFFSGKKSWLTDKFDIKNFFAADDKDRVYLTNNVAVQKAARCFEKYLDNKFNAGFRWKGTYFVWCYSFAIWSFLICVIGIVVPCCLYGAYGAYVVYDSQFFLMRMWLMILIGVLTFLSGVVFWYIFYDLSKRYTSLGKQCKTDLDGFKMFLAATESERLKVIGTPPDKTPELYETYLPYAVAFGVEQAWSKRFAPLFENLERAGTPYVFVWYRGNLWSHGGFRPFASSFRSSFNTAISSSTYAPGSRSGFGGRGGGGGGFSGGGGGGGGGGGR